MPVKVGSAFTQIQDVFGLLAAGSTPGIDRVSAWTLIERAFSDREGDLAYPNSSAPLPSVQLEKGLSARMAPAFPPASAEVSDLSGPEGSADATCVPKLWGKKRSARRPIPPWRGQQRKEVSLTMSTLMDPGRPGVAWWKALSKPGLACDLGLIKDLAKW